MSVRLRPRAHDSRTAAKNGSRSAAQRAEREARKGGPLAGVRVLDFTRVVAGPYCTMLLGDFGADVIKVEAPDGGDELRALGPPFLGGESVFFLSVNRNKRSVTVDLREPSGRAAIVRLIPSVDVVVENFRPGVMDRLELGWNRLRRLNRRLIYCSISAFRGDSRHAARPGYDLMVSGLSGLMSITGEPDRAPLRPGVNLVDLTAGTNAAIGILLAVIARERTGRGQRVESTLMDGAFGVLGQLASIYLNTGQVPARRPPDDLHPQIVPYGTFRAADDAFVNVCVPNNRFWAGFCAALDLPSLEHDPRFATNAARIEHRNELTRMLRERFRTAPRDHWIERLDAHDVPAGPVRSIGEALDDPYFQESGLLARLAHPRSGALTLPGIPIRLSATPGAIRRPPPVLGEHTDAVLGRAARPRR